MFIRILRIVSVLDRAPRRAVESAFRGLGMSLVAVLIAVVGSAAAVVSAPEVGATNHELPAVKHIVLLGASIGKAWNIEELPSRVGDRRYRFEFVGVYSPDKWPALAGLLARRENKPAAIIIKECASYFPGNLGKLRELVPAWVGACRKANVEPILATAVPVVSSYPLRIFLLTLRHGRFEFPRRAFDEIIAYNDWVRSFAHEKGLAVLDLEAAVRSSASDRHLKSSYARRDGLHLNERGYRALDAIVIPALDGVTYPAR